MQRVLVGVVTLPGNYNYGNRLQNHAVHSILREAGLRSISLNVDRTKSLLSKTYSFIKRICGDEQINHETYMSETRLRAFKEFSSQFKSKAVAGSSSDMRRLSNECTLLFTGSDQVWNPLIVGRKLSWYTLSCVPSNKRVALAPSVGVDVLTPKQSRILSKALIGFPRLSVREKRGAELIKECTGRDAEVICDPTLTLSAEEWRAVADDRCTPSRPYVFTYLLGGVGAEAADVLDKVTDHGRIPVVPLSDRQKPGEPDAGPAEFISLIDHASHVVTDSFHAAVFSSILQTPLTIVHREGGASMFSRLEQLSQMLGIEEKVYGSPTFDLSRAGDYEGVPEAIDREREKFMSYLEGCLDTQLPGWREGARD